MFLGRKWQDVNLARLLIFVLLEPAVAFLGILCFKHLAYKDLFGTSWRTGAPSVKKSNPAGIEGRASERSMGELLNYSC